MMNDGRFLARMAVLTDSIAGQHICHACSTDIVQRAMFVKGYSVDGLELFALMLQI